METCKISMYTGLLQFFFKQLLIGNKLDQRTVDASNIIAFKGHLNKEIRET